MLDIPAPLLTALDEELSGVRAPLKAQVRALEELFAFFTRERPGLRGRSYLDIPKYRCAYLRYHLPLNFARASCCLEHVRRLCPRIDSLPLVVDLGAGPGSASLATLLSSSNCRRTYELYDRSRASLQIARRLFDACGRHSVNVMERLERCTTRQFILPRLPRIEAPALVWVAMVLNELMAGRQAAGRIREFAERLTTQVPEGSIVVMVEPALRGPGRQLLRLHDELLELNSWRMLGPCTHQVQCPLLTIRGRPWCHFHFRWRAPRCAHEVAKPLGLTSNSSSLAFLAVERVASTDSNKAEAKGARQARVIGDVMSVRSGKSGIYLCEAGHRVLLTDPPRDCRRGDLLRAAGKDGYRLTIPWSAKRKGK